MKSFEYEIKIKDWSDRVDKFQYYRTLFAKMLKEKQVEAYSVELIDDIVKIKVDVINREVRVTKELLGTIPGIQINEDLSKAS